MSTEELTRRLEEALERLREAAGADRCTLRFDDPARDWSVQIPCAEAVAEGVKSLKVDGSIDQRAAATVKWLAKNRRVLLQPDLAETDVPAPPALVSFYGVSGQMLGPLLRDDGFLQGWISAHYLKVPGSLGPEEEAAMRQALSSVGRLLDLPQDHLMPIGR